MNDALIYVSFSVDEADCQSRAAQEARCRDYCKFVRPELWPVEVLADPEPSGRRLSLFQRDQGRRLKSLLGKQKLRHIVALRLDRLFRNAEDGTMCLNLWQKQGVSLHLAAEGGVSIDTGDATGQLVARMLLAIAARQREISAESTSGTMRSRQAKGWAMSLIAPYGQRDDETGPYRAVCKNKKCRSRSDFAANPISAPACTYCGGPTRLRALRHIPDDQERAQITRMVEWAKLGRSEQKIAFQLTLEGVPTRGNRYLGTAPQKWDSQLVARILRREGITT